MRKKKIYTTHDVCQAGYLVLKNHPPELMDRNGKIIFRFILTDSLFKDLSDYNNGAEVKAIHLSFVVKKLESQITATRNKIGIGLWDWD